MSIPRGNSAGSRPISGPVPRRRTVLHRPLPASHGPRIGLQRHGHFLCQLLPQMWPGMILVLHAQAFPLFMSFTPALSSCAAPGVWAVHRPSGVLWLLQKHLLHFYRWKQDDRSFCCMGSASMCTLLYLFFPPSQTDYVCLCRRGVPGWRTVHVMTAWKQQWELWYLPPGLFVHLLMTQNVFRSGQLKFMPMMNLKCSQILFGRLTNVSADGFEFWTGPPFNFDLLSCRMVV